MTANPNQTAPSPSPIRVAVSYRVIWHWRLPIFQRLAACEGYDVHVFHGADFPGTKVLNAKEIEGVEHTELWTIRWVSQLLRLPPWPICPGLILRLWQFSPDVILAEGNSNLLNNLQVFLFAQITRTPVVFWTLGELQNKPVTRLDQRVFRGITRWMERKATALLGYSSVALDYFKRQGYPEAKQFRAVNVVDTERVHERVQAAREQTDAVWARHGLTGKSVVLFVGAIIAEKRLEDLVEAFEQVVKVVDQARLVIVGDGPTLPELRSRVEASTARDQIVLAGRVVDGVSAYFLMSDVLVLPHLGGLAISEAMAHGLPVIATVADGCEVDLIEDGANGYLLPVGRPDLIAQHVTELLLDPARLAAMKARSQAIIATKFNTQTYLDGIRAAIDYAAEQSPSADRRGYASR